MQNKSQKHYPALVIDKFVYKANVFVHHTVPWQFFTTLKFQKKKFICQQIIEVKESEH